MKTSDRIWILIWNLPLLLFIGLTLSSDLCKVNDWASWFIAMSLYFNRVYTDLKHDQLEIEIKQLKEKLK